MDNRVVVTGIGVVSPIGSNIDEFLMNLREGKSGVTYSKELEDKNFVCRVAGIPKYDGHNDEFMSKYFPLECDKAIKYAVSAAIDAWKDARLEIPDLYSDHSNDNVGVVAGSVCAGHNFFIDRKELIDGGLTKKLGSWYPVNAMHSGVAAFLSYIFAASSSVEYVSSACATGSEAIVRAYERIKYGDAEIMLAGGCDADSPYLWAGFDTMRLLCRNSNDEPTKANRQLSALAKGFAPAAGAGMLVLEEYGHATARGAKIYAEILGGHINAGGQRGGGSMTLPNSRRVVDCIRIALEKSGIEAHEIDYINGHLTSTMADVIEVKNWCNALSLKGKFPYLNSTKSLIGHTIGAAGAIEAIATILQMNGRFIHASLNSRPLHPEIEEIYDPDMIPENRIDDVDIRYAVKANFGFGDVNACFVLKNLDL